MYGEAKRVTRKGLLLLVEDVGTQEVVIRTARSIIALCIMALVETPTSSSIPTIPLSGKEENFNEGYAQFPVDRDKCQELQANLREDWMEHALRVMA